MGIEPVTELDGPTPAHDSDAALLAAHVDGDPDAFGVLFARHRDRLWAVALRTAGDPETAADGLQEALIAAFRRADSFRGDAQVTTWLHRIVVNACLDRLRAAKVRRTEPLDEQPSDDEQAGRGTVAVDPAADPVEQAGAAERRTAVLAALRALPDAQRAAVVLVDMEGYSVAEAAEILDCAEGTVKSRCSRARARLAPLLDHLLEAETEARADAVTVTGNPPAGADVGSGTRRGPPAAAEHRD